MKFVKIFVDSRAAIQAIGNEKVKSKTVARTMDALNRLGERALSVTICWIPAHKGHFGNEKADELAKEGTRLDQPTTQTPQPQVVLKNRLTEIAYKTWATEWTTYTGAAHSKHFYLTPMPTKARYVYKLARLELGRFVRLITGHNNLNHFQTRIGLHNDQGCRLCMENREDFIHFATSCPRLHQTRIDHFMDSPPCADMRWSVRALLDFSYTPAVNAAFEGTWTRNDPTNRDNMDTSDEATATDGDTSD